MPIPDGSLAPLLRNGPKSNQAFGQAKQNVKTPVCALSIHQMMGLKKTSASAGHRRTPDATQNAVASNARFRGNERGVGIEWRLLVQPKKRCGKGGVKPEMRVHRGRLEMDQISGHVEVFASVSHTPELRSGNQTQRRAAGIPPAGPA